MLRPSNSPRCSPVVAVKHMASSLSVEWAKNGVRVNALRHQGFFLLLSDDAKSSPRISPGYMLTKLTRTILSNNPELKVTFLHPPHLSTSWYLSENVGRFNADGKGKGNCYSVGGADLTKICFDRWGNQKILTCVVFFLFLFLSLL